MIDFEIRWADHVAEGRIAPCRVFEGVHKVVPDGGVTVIRPAFVRFPGLDYLTSMATHWMEIRRELREFRPDVLVGLGILNASLGIRAARRAGIPFVYYLIDELHRLVPQRLFRGLSKVIEQSNLRHASLVLAINEALREYTVAMGADPQRTKVITAGIDLARFADASGRLEVRRQHGIAEGDLVLFFMGWLYPFSGLQEVAETVSGTESARAVVRLLVVGKGELSEELARISREPTAAGRILLDGWRPYEEMPRLLSAADVCLLPAQRNAIMRNIVPIKIYEYMAAGKPVITTRLPGLVKEFSEGHGVVYVGEPSEAVAKALDLLAAGALPEMGRKAREFVSNRDWADIVSDFERTLAALVAGPGRQGGR